MTDPAKLTKGSVVILEDDHYILEYLKFSVEQQGLQVYTAAEGEAGFHLIQSHLPRLVILDLMLPKMDGFTILRQMGENPVTAEIPVVVVSAYTATESTRRMVQSQKNVKEVFTKPIRSTEFVAKIRQIMGMD